MSTFSERAHKQVLTVKKNMHHILNSSTGTLVSGHFHRARWRIPPREYVLASETCSHSSKHA